GDTWEGHEFHSRRIGICSFQLSRWGHPLRPILLSRSEPRRLKAGCPLTLNRHEWNSCPSRFFLRIRQHYSDLKLLQQILLHKQNRRVKLVILVFLFDEAVAFVFAEQPP